MSQIEFDVSDSDELVLMESKTMRDSYAFMDSVLDKVKIVPQLPDTLEVTIQMAAEYYEVSAKTVESIIKRNREEFNEYGEIQVLKGKALSEFKALLQDAGDLKSAPSLTLISRRGLLRVGMMLTESNVAKAIRHYLLNVEEVSEKAQREWAVEREIARRERRQLTDAIRDFYEGTLKDRGKGLEYAVFTDLVYRVLFDMTAKEIREAYGLEKGQATRDFLSTRDLRKVVRVEQTVASLLLLGKEYAEIRDELMAKKDRFAS